MLLRFGVENFLSLRDRQEFNLIGSKLAAGAGFTHRIESTGENCLPCALIYGANASGKSNLVAALSFVRRAILFSHSRGEAGEQIPRRVFALDASYEQKSTDCDLDFVINGVRYHYGFKASHSEFLQEWLYSFPNGRRQMLFEREKQEFSFGRSFRGKNKTISELTRPNSLFLSAAIQNDHDEATKVAAFFQAMSFVEADSASVADAMSTAQKTVDERIIKFLTEVGTGIVGFRRSQTKVDESTIAAMETFIKSVNKANGRASDMSGSLPRDLWEFEFSHSTRGAPAFLKMDVESAGTRRLFVLLSRAFGCLDRGGVFVLDELDAHLHTQAAEAIIRLFLDKDLNKNESQIIATTHDTNILKSKIVSRDAIWFAEKDMYGATDIYPLSDFRTRRADNLEKGYLQGRFGAVPFGDAGDALIEALINA